MARFVLLSFDVEEFDMPLEYNFAISAEEQMQVGKKGLDAIRPFLSQYPATLFTTANFASHYPQDIKELAARHEIASHTFYHSEFIDEHLLSSRKKLAEISGQSIDGLRMPRMRKVEMEEVKKAGYAYDSSINPTWLPGRYNNFHLPRTAYRDEGMLRIPASVSPNLRIPLFWLSFKNFPLSFFQRIAKQTLQKDGYICLYFHPWEFTPVGGFGLPAYTTRHSGEALLNRLWQLAAYLRKEGDFVTMRHFIQQKSPA